tara:strand:+ start:293 stop:913 length:621 start_codon:yes stop_codon:yes gene_type:complete
MTLYLKLTPKLTQTIQNILTSTKIIYNQQEQGVLENLLTSTSNSATVDELALVERLSVVPLKELIHGSSIQIPSLEKKTNISTNPEQELRKQNLKNRVQERELHRMISNVDSRQKMARKFRAGAAVSLKSASFGLHIILGMVFGFVAGYLVARTAYGGGQTVQVIGGIIGMVGTMIMEVVLYIIRDEKARLESEKRNQKILEGKSL